MSNLISGNANELVKAAAINNALLSKKNTTPQKSISKTTKLTGNKDVNPNVDATEVTITNLQGLSQNLGLYNHKGIVPVASVHKVGSDIHLKTSTDYSINNNSVPSNFGWTNNTIANSTIVASEVAVPGDISNSDSDNNIDWSKNYRGVDKQGTNFNPGIFVAGKQIPFGGLHKDAKDFYQTGSAFDNPQKYQHAISTNTPSTTQVGFEDLSLGVNQDLKGANIKNLDGLQNTVPQDNHSNDIKPVLGSVIKGSYLKSLANNKDPNEGELHKTFFANLQSAQAQNDQTQDSFNESNSFKQIQDNLTTQDYFNKKFTLENFKQIDKATNNSGIKDEEHSNKLNAVASKNQTKQDLVNDIDNEFLKEEHPLSNKLSNDNSNQIDEVNRNQNTITNISSNQEVTSVGNKPGNSAAAQLLNNFLHKNIN